MYPSHRTQGQERRAVSKSKAIGTVLVVALLAQAFARDRKVMMDRALLPAHARTIVRSDASVADRDGAQAALAAQAEIDPQRVVETLLPHLLESESPVGVETLASVMVAEATAGLIKLAVEHPSGSMRREAIRALVARKDLTSIETLFRIADRDPSLIVRQEAVVGLAELGNDAVLRDLVALLDPLAPAGLAGRARSVLLRFTAVSFEDPAGVCAWMDRNGISPSRTSIGPPALNEPARLTVVDGLVVRTEPARIVFESDGAPPRSGRVILDHASGSVLLEVRNVDGVPVGRALDIPDIGPVSERYAIVRGTRTGSSWTIALPRTGQLQDGALRVEWIDGSDDSHLASGG